MRYENVFVNDLITRHNARYSRPALAFANYRLASAALMLFSRFCTQPL